MKGPADRILSPRIVSIVEVRDTRDYEEVSDGKFAPVPGSGVPRDCDRCGRNHFVHATVMLEDGSTSVVGTGCMQQGEMTIAKRVKSAERLAKRVAQLTAEYESAFRKHADYQTYKAKWEREAVRLVPPEFVESRRYVSWAKKEMPTLELEDVWEPMHGVDESVNAADRAYRKQGHRASVLRAWTAKRMEEVGLPSPHHVEYPHDLERSLARAEESLRKSLG